MTRPEDQSNSIQDSSDGSIWDLPSGTGERPEQQGRMAEALSLEAGQVPPNLLRWVKGTTAVLAGSIVVSAMIPIQDYVVASGEVEPSGDVQKVQHLEGGIVREQLVQEGQRVRRGQVLLKLDEGEIGSQEQQTATRITNLMLEQRELRRSLGEEALNASKGTPTNPALDVSRAYKDVQDERRKEYLRQLGLAKERIATMQAKRIKYLAEVAILRKQVKPYAALEQVGAMSHNDVLEAQRRQASTETQLAELDGNIREAQIAMSEMHAKLKMETYEQLAKVTTEKAELQSVLGRQRGERERLLVRSPVDGIVKSFTIKTIGGVIAPGSQVAEVVPVGERLEAFTRVKPKDIGNVRIGQKVELKVQAYDYSRYGSIPGKVKSISAGTFQDEKTGEPFYKVRVVLDRAYAGKVAGKNLLVPGMTLTADILTDRTNLLMYLLSPVRKGLGSALHEQ
ncbi:MAG: HlyD family type I secretion periplasmic adaptor subunit [Synechococcaceae bacterium WB9_2_170]|nr:HlyD family type I secretion periplasmic adaptor subunit [Synechococcaceae bacterium WB9_2_170]